MSYYSLPGLRNESASLPELTKVIDPNSIIDFIVANENLELKDVISPSRKRELSLCRFLICRYLRSNTLLSLHRIGQLLGGRDHSTVAHSNSKLQDLIDTDDIIRDKVQFYDKNLL